MVVAVVVLLQVHEVHNHHKMSLVEGGLYIPNRRMVAEDNPGLEPADKMEPAVFRNGVTEAYDEKQQEAEGGSA